MHRGPTHGWDRHLDDGPKTLAGHVVPWLHQAAADAGRQESDVRVVASLPVAVTDDVDGARKQAAEQFAVYGVLPSYRAMLDREGYVGPDAAIIGDEATVKDRLAELRAAAVDEYVGATFTRHPRRAPTPARCCVSWTRDGQKNSGVTTVTGVRSTLRRVREWLIRRAGGRGEKPAARD